MLGFIVIGLDLNLCLHRGVSLLMSHKYWKNYIALLILQMKTQGKQSNWKSKVEDGVTIKDIENKP